MVELTTAPTSHPIAEWGTEAIPTSVWNTPKFRSSRRVTDVASGLGTTLHTANLGQTSTSQSLQLQQGKMTWQIRFGPISQNANVKQQARERKQIIYQQNDRKPMGKTGTVLSHRAE